MATHTLTAEQMQKFIGSVGGVPQSVTGTQFSTNELRKLAEPIGGLRAWPKITGDPQVNFAVDCIDEDEGEEPTYDKQLYAEEIRVHKAGGSFRL